MRKYIAGHEIEVESSVEIWPALLKVQDAIPGTSLVRVVRSDQAWTTVATVGEAMAWLAGLEPLDVHLTSRDWRMDFSAHRDRRIKDPDVLTMAVIAEPRDRDQADRDAEIIYQLASRAIRKFADAQFDARVQAENHRSSWPRHLAIVRKLRGA